MNWPQGHNYINIWLKQVSFLHKDIILCIIMLTVIALPAEVRGLYFQLFQLFAAAFLFIKTQRIRAGSKHLSGGAVRRKGEKRRKTEKWCRGYKIRPWKLAFVVRTWSRRRERETNIHSDGKECVKWCINHELSITGASVSVAADRGRRCWWYW